MQTAFFPQYTPQQNVPSGSSFQSKRKRQSWTQEDFAYESSKVSSLFCSCWWRGWCPELRKEKERRNKKQHLSFFGRNGRLDGRLSGVPSSASHHPLVSFSDVTRTTLSGALLTKQQARVRSPGFERRTTFPLASVPSASDMDMDAGDTSMDSTGDDAECNMGMGMSNANGGGGMAEFAPVQRDPAHTHSHTFGQEPINQFGQNHFQPQQYQQQYQNQQLPQVVVPEPQYQRDAQAHSYNYSSFDACGSGGFGFGPGADEDDGSDEESESS